MINVEQCKKILQKNGVFYSNETVSKIRTVLYQLAEIEFLNFQNKKNEGSNLFKSING
jgi:hypothetical protein